MRIGTAPVRRRWRKPRMRFLWMMLICLAAGFLAPVRAQNGFTNIDCGGSTTSNYVDAKNFTWEADDDYLQAGGATASVSSRQNVTLSVPLETVSYFPAGTSPKKNCYVVPALSRQVYLVRASFFYGNYDGLQTTTPITFQLSLGSAPWVDVVYLPNSTVPLVLEAIGVPVVGTVLSVCLIRTVDTSTPFINTLEIRPALGTYSYTHEDVGGTLHLLARANFGEKLMTYRYPLDAMDRIWPPYPQVYPDLVTQVTDISTADPISDSPWAPDLPPQVVMQTAVTAPLLFNFTNFGALNGQQPSRVLYLSMFFSEYNKTLAPTDKLDMDVSFSFIRYNGNFLVNLSVFNRAAPLPVLSTHQLLIANFTVANLPIIGEDLSWYFFRNRTSTLDPVISALEVYLTIPIGISTHSDDAMVLGTLKTSFGLPAWGGDPCFPVPWDQLQCSPDGRVTSLNLSNRNLTGAIPSSIGDLVALTSLNLSLNYFAGLIPVELGLLSALTTLDLSDNQLSGAFPNWLTRLPLKELDVSNNNLNGSFPDSYFRLGSRFRYSGNPHLLCTGVSCPITATPPPATSPPPAPKEDSSSSSSSIGPIVGGIAAAVVFIGLVGLLLFCYLRRRPKGQQLPPYGTPEGMSDSGASPQKSADVVSLAARGQAQPFTLRAIQIATSNYSRQIGSGGFGPVYLGVLANSREVAVKRMSATSTQGLREFTTEIELLSTTHHRNLVSLIGYCRESSELILLYEYMAGGDLKDRLYGRISHVKPLTWLQRLEIAVDSAKGLEYLHHGCRPSIIHRDVKSNNILLTSKLEAKFSDFGLSKLSGDGKSHVTTMVKGTVGYLDPEYYQTGQLTEKSDVYSFGVVLLEILCGQAPTVPEDSRVPANQRSLIDRVRSAVHSGNLERVVDHRMAGRYQSESAWKFVETAMSCVSTSSQQRPNFVQIVADLTQAKETENPTSQVGSTTISSNTFTSRSGQSSYPTGSSTVTGNSSDWYDSNTQMPTRVHLGAKQPVAR